MLNLPLPFYYKKKSTYYSIEWERLMEYLKGRSDFCDIEHEIEAKALAVMSIARRLICSAWAIGEGLGWKRTFVESSTLLFPMLELVGCARLGGGGFDECLYAGAEWLYEPNDVPTRGGKDVFKKDKRIIESLARHMVDHETGPEIKDLFYLRNYHLHGNKNSKDSSIRIADLINYELPKAISLEANKSLKHYWNQLKLDKGKDGWIDCLAKADIQPFIIQGSNIFEYGLVDDDIMIWLENPDSTCLDLYIPLYYNQNYLKNPKPA